MPMFLLEGLRDTAKSWFAATIRALVFHCFLSDSRRGTVGARLPRAQGSAAAGSSTEELPVTQMHVVRIKRHRCPLLSCCQQGSQTRRLTYETGWLWAMRDIELNHGKKYSRHDLYWNSILFTHSTFWRKHSYMPKCFIWIIKPVDNFKKWCPAAVWVSSSSLLQVITLFFSWFRYIILFPEDIKDLIIHWCSCCRLCFRCWALLSCILRDIQN